MRRSLVTLALLLFPLAALAERDPSVPGPYAVGITTLGFIKPSETTGAPRRLDTLVWYPAVPGTGTPEGATLRDATVRRRRWPLVMFSHGSCGIPQQSTFLTTHLASWGFVVAAPPHPGNTFLDFPGCSQAAALADSFANRPADITFVIDQLLAANADPRSPFGRRLHRKRIGMSGHSFGGHTTLRVAAADRRVRGAVALAPAIFGITGLRIETSTLVLGAELDSLTPFATAVRGAFALLEGPRFLVEILNTGHCAFAGACVPLLCGTGCEPGTISLEEAHELTRRYALSFLMRYVAGRGGFDKALRPERAPSGVVVEAAFPKG
jgi:predicted dienelactone hydrolase